MIERKEMEKKFKNENWEMFFRRCSLLFFFDVCEWIFPSEKWDEPAFFFRGHWLGQKTFLIYVKE